MFLQPPLLCASRGFPRRKSARSRNGTGPRAAGEGIAGSFPAEFSPEKQSAGFSHEGIALDSRGNIIPVFLPLVVVFGHLELSN